jgi:type IV pilus assembly protein PilX
MAIKNTLTRTPRNASGFSLIVTLLLLVALSLIGVASLRNVSLQEKMAGNFYFRTTALQDAHGALRQARGEVEGWVASGSAPLLSQSATAGVWSTLIKAAATTKYWSDDSNWSSAGSAVATAGMSAKWAREGETAKHFICADSEAGCRVNYIRMTARTKDTASGAAVVIQDINVYPTD